MRLRWNRRALAALDAIANHIAQDSPATARRVVEKVEKAVGQLTTHPSLGRAGRVAGTRELVIPGTPLIVPYRVREGHVEILAVIHTARRWPNDF